MDKDKGMYLVPSLQIQEKTFVHRWLKHQHTVSSISGQEVETQIRGSKIRSTICFHLNSIICFLFDPVGQFFQTSHLQKSPNQASDYTDDIQHVLKHPINTNIKVLLRPYSTLPCFGYCASCESGRFSFSLRKGLRRENAPPGGAHPRAHSAGESHHFDA